MKNKNLFLLLGIGAAAWMYFRYHQRLLARRETAYARANGAASPQAGLGCGACGCASCAGNLMGTLYSEDPITGPYGEVNFYGDSGVIGQKNMIWNRIEDASSL